MSDEQMFCEDCDGPVRKPDHGMKYYMDNYWWCDKCNKWVEGFVKKAESTEELYTAPTEEIYIEVQKQADRMNMVGILVDNGYCVKLEDRSYSVEPVESKEDVDPLENRHYIVITNYSREEL